jgi:serine/threonine protein kinase
LKPENVLYDRQNKRSILIDFGVSCKFFERGTNKEMLTLTGTPLYRAPEMFTGGGYDERVDLWALGVMIYKLVEKVTPF